MSNRFLALVAASLAVCCTVAAQPRTDTLLSRLLQAIKEPVVQAVVNNPGEYRCQVIYTQVNRNSRGVPSFKNFYFNYDPALYFNPASMVKMPLAFLAVEKLNKLKRKGIDKFTALKIDSSYTGQVKAIADTTSETGLPSIAHYIKRAFLISENDPYNRLYQFLGQGYINRQLHKKGYSSARITRQFMGYTEEQNRQTNAMQFVGANGKVILEQPAAYNSDSFKFSNEVKIGKAHYNNKDSLVQQPFDFTRHNFVSLHHLQQMLQSILFPSSVPASQRFDISESDRQFLLKYLSQFPSETSYPKYDTSLFYDSYVKFFFKDSSRSLPAGLRIFNKVGWSYGFLTDVSYVIDTLRNVEFMLAATLYVNSDGILNDGKYDYESIGYPFLYQLGQAVYQNELLRQKTSGYKIKNPVIKYDRRADGDQRPSIREVDN